MDKAAQCGATLDEFDAEFDAVFSNAALYWILDHHSAAREEVLPQVAELLEPALCTEEERASLVTQRR